MKDKIIEMLKMQEALDNSFLQYMGNDKIDIEKVRMALFDELGEVNHEMKAEWCYWKKSQKPVDRDKLKEELSDVWHFTLSLHRLINRITFSEFEFKRSKIWHDNVNWEVIIRGMALGNADILYDCIGLTEKLGFTFDEMYQAYMDKNKVNYERMKRGY